MPVPKSVVKVKKDGIEFVSNVDAVNYSIRELSRAALRDVGKLLKKRYKDRYYSVYKKHSGNGKFAVSSKVDQIKTSPTPCLKIGIRHASPGNVVRGFYTFFHEVGTTRYSARPLLKRVVEDNLAEIQRIEGAYLSALNDESDAKRLMLIDENVEDDGLTERMNEIWVCLTGPRG